MITADTLSILKQTLQTFQAQRIRSTYADLAQIPEYQKLVEFFFSQIYGSQDFGFRNESIKSLHKRLSSFLRGEIIEAVGKVIELNDLSDMLDQRMAEKMLAQQPDRKLTETSYQMIYRSLDNYEERVYQIDLLLEATRGIHHTSRLGLIGWTLKAVQQAAHLAGMGKIVDFLVQGYEAFHTVQHIDDFLATVEAREKVLNDELFGVG
jgi:hypothetical protein